ncbi:MAG: hypothetical protein ACXQTV_02005 [Candidatus Hecatellaceae archaeon]
MGSHRNLYRKFLARELARALREAFRDREKAELVAVGNYVFLNIERGEVLASPGYLNPSIERALNLCLKPLRRR